MPTLLEHLRQEDWRQDFDQGALDRGARYAQQRKARLRAMDETQLLASCAGSAETPYLQTIRLAPHGLGVIGRCTCPVGLNCKHCVAAILQLLSDGPPAARPSPSPRHRRAHPGC